MIVGIKQPQYGVQIFRGAGAKQQAIDAGIKFNSHLSGIRASGGHNGGSSGGNGGSSGGNGGSDSGNGGSGASGNHNGGANGGANPQVPNSNYAPIPPKTTTYPPTTYAPTTTTTTTTTAAPTTVAATEPPTPPPTQPPYSPPKPPVYRTAYRPIPSYPRPTPSYRHPTHPPRIYGSPTGYTHPQYKPVEANYDWEYAVKDNHYNNFGHKESRHGYSATGTYYVSLPDGRIQTVTYVADENGYKPVISFQGQAAYPDQ